MKKPSLKVLEGNEFAQSHITNQAMMFAEMTRKVAKENSLTQAQVIKESQRKRS